MPSLDAQSLSNPILANLACLHSRHYYPMQTRIISICFQTLSLFWSMFCWTSDGLEIFWLLELCREIGMSNKKNSSYLEPLRFSISSSWSDWCLQQLPSTNLVNSFRRSYPCLKIYPEQGVKDCKTWLSFCLAFVLRARAKWQCYCGWQTSAKPVRESS